MAVSQPRGITDYRVHLVAGLRKPEWTSEIANIVAPDMIAAFVMEAAHCSKGTVDSGLVFGWNLKPRKQRLQGREGKGDFGFLREERFASSFTS